IRFDDAFAHQELEERSQRGEMSRDRRAAQLAATEVCEVGADRQMIGAAQLEQVAPDREVVVAEEADERFEIVAIGSDRVRRDVALVGEIVEKIADFVLHARRSRSVLVYAAMADQDASHAPLKKTPLNQLHKDLGGKMVDFGGWELPVQFSGILDEHQAVRDQSGLFDVSHMGEITVKGPDALPLLQLATCIDVSKLEDGRAQY